MSTEDFSMQRGSVKETRSVHLRVALTPQMPRAVRVVIDASAFRDREDYAVSVGEPRGIVAFDHELRTRCDDEALEFAHILRTSVGRLGLVSEIEFKSSSVHSRPQFIPVSLSFPHLLRVFAVRFGRENCW
jgi:hypothetical protein